MPGKGAEYALLRKKLLFWIAWLQNSFNGIILRGWDAVTAAASVFWDKNCGLATSRSKMTPPTLSWHILIYLNITLWNNANTFLTGPGLSHSEILEAAKWNRTRDWNWNYVDHFDNTAITQFMSKMTLPPEKLEEKNCLKRKKGQMCE